ncbi:MAG: hypothetical protein ACK5V3_12435 [Bdellovibrionales bacterium]
MRTTELKIGTEKKEAILVAGGPGFKIYSASGFDGWVLVLGRKVFPVTEESQDFKVISKYVNLKYQPINEQATIFKNFESLVESLKTPSQPDAESSR